MRDTLKWALAFMGFVGGAYVCDVIIRRELAASRARAYAESVGKPMLNVGAGTPKTALFGPTTYGDVNCDLGNMNDCGSSPYSCHCDVTKLPFPDRVYIITPEWWDPVAWLYWDHKWFFPDGHGGGAPVRLW
jgi:hypothetical protein